MRGRRVAVVVMCTLCLMMTIGGAAAPATGAPGDEVLTAPYEEGYSHTICSGLGAATSSCITDASSDKTTGRMTGRAELEPDGTPVIVSSSAYTFSLLLLSHTHEAANAITYTFNIRVRNLVLSPGTGAGHATVSLGAQAWQGEYGSDDTPVEVDDTGLIRITRTLQGFEGEQLPSGKTDLNVQMDVEASAGAALPPVRSKATATLESVVVHVT